MNRRHAKHDAAGVQISDPPARSGDDAKAPAGQRRPLRGIHGALRLKAGEIWRHIDLECIAGERDPATRRAY